MVNNKLLIKIKKTLERNSGEEHFLNTWLALVNSNLTVQNKIRNTKQFIYLLRVLRKEGITYSKKTEQFRTNGDFIRFTYYKIEVNR